jgi:phosphatidylserine decarboxylase
MIENGEVEQVKGMTYSLSALLGTSDLATTSESRSNQNLAIGNIDENQPQSSVQMWEEDIVKADEEFANMNGISYTLPTLFSGPGNRIQPPSDASTTPKSASVAEVRADLALGDGSGSSWFSKSEKVPTDLYYFVIYLAPGDYHRFHSPTSWVVSTRRHFAGELYSVSPYLQRTLPGLFTLNERVVLLGRWRWGFFSFTPVGATNVGSIKINFDAELRTNSLTTDTAADRAAEEAARRGDIYPGYAEATYEKASWVLGGHALRRGEEIGGFQLGSSIVVVFEAPRRGRKSNEESGVEGMREGGWRWGVKKGQRVRVGEAIGWVDDV